MKPWAKALGTAIWLAGCHAPDDEQAWHVDEVRRVVHARDAVAPTSADELKAFAPLGVQRYRLALSSSGALQVGDGALIDEPSPRHRERTFGVVSSLGNLSLAGGVRVGVLYAFGQRTALAAGATVQSYARVFGGLSSGPHWLVPQRLHPLSDDLVEEFSWHVAFTPTTNDVTTHDGSALQLAPGHYRSLHVRPKESAAMVAGDYYFDALEVNPGGELRLENRAAPLRIWIKERLDLRGSLRELTVRGDVLWGYSGSASPRIDCDFHGTLVASRSAVVLPKTPLPHVGAFFAHGIFVEPGARIEARSIVLNEPAPHDLTKVCQDCRELAQRISRSCCNLLGEAILVEHYRSSEPIRAVGRDCEREAIERYAGCLLQEGYRPGSCVYVGKSGPDSAACAFQE